RLARGGQAGVVPGLRAGLNDVFDQSAKLAKALRRQAGVVIVEPPLQFGLVARQRVQGGLGGWASRRRFLCRGHWAGPRRAPRGRGETEATIAPRSEQRP